MNTIYIVVFLMIIFVFLKMAGLNPVKFVADMLIRTLSGIIFLSVMNFFIISAGQKVYVSINEISACISAVFGISGLIMLYIFRWSFTIH